MRLYNILYKSICILWQQNYRKHQGKWYHHCARGSRFRYLRYWTYRALCRWRQCGKLVHRWVNILNYFGCRGIYSRGRSRCQCRRTGGWFHLCKVCSHWVGLFWWFFTKELLVPPPGWRFCFFYYNKKKIQRKILFILYFRLIHLREFQYVQYHSWFFQRVRLFLRLPFGFHFPSQNRTFY